MTGLVSDVSFLQVRIQICYRYIQQRLVSTLPTTALSLSYHTRSVDLELCFEYQTSHAAARHKRMMLRARTEKRYR